MIKVNQNLFSYFHVPLFHAGCFAQYPTPDLETNSNISPFQTRPPLQSPISQLLLKTSRPSHHRHAAHLGSGSSVQQRPDNLCYAKTGYLVVDDNLP